MAYKSTTVKKIMSTTTMIKPATRSSNSVQSFKSNLKSTFQKPSNGLQQIPPLPAKSIQSGRSGLKSFLKPSKQQPATQLPVVDEISMLRKKVEELIASSGETKSDLDSCIERLRTDNLKLKQDYLEAVKERDDYFNAWKKMDESIAAFGETKSDLNSCIGRLRTDNLKLKQDYLEAVKERDDYFDAWKKVEEKYEQTNSQFQKLKTDCDAKSSRIRQEEVYKSLVESNVIDQTQSLEMELHKKGQEMEKLRSEYEQLEKSIENYKDVNQEQAITIENLKENLITMETRAQCWINRNVHDKFQTKINHLEQVVEQLTTDKRLLCNEYKKAAAENREQTTQREKYIARQQSYIDEQQKLINLMRKVKFKPSKFDQTSTMNSIFLKFEDEQKMRQDLERLIQENNELIKRNMEYKNVVNSHPFKQLFVSY